MSKRGKSPNNAKRTERRGKKRSWLRVLLILTLFLAVSFGATLYFAYYYFSRDLPDILKIAEYEPTLATEVYSADGRQIAEFASQRRRLVQYEDIPSHVRNAFIAIEDKRFFEHGGFDLRRIFGALLKNVEEGKIVQGGSTITQQVVKNLIFSSERKYTRKIKEAILSYKIEKSLSKREIFYIYLNHIYFGDNSYGVEAASQNYFGKSVRDINVAEAALLAALPKAPERYSPRKHPDRARRRQRLVLKMMADEGFITQWEREEAEDYKIKIIPRENKNLEVAPYFVETVRQYLERKVGTRAFLHGGFKVFTTLDVDLSLAAQWYLRRRAIELGIRTGWKPILTKLRSKKAINEFLTTQQVVSLERGKVYEAVVLGVKPIVDQSSVEGARLSHAEALKDGNKQYLYHVRLGIGLRKLYMNLAYSHPLGSAVPVLNNPYSDKFAPASGYKGWSIVDFIPRRGDVVKVKIVDENKGRYRADYYYDLQSQGAVLSMTTNGQIIAMVGGLDFNRSQFNRALQAKRQPGSSFKPIVYAAAIAKDYTETSLLQDIPVVIKDWAPKNYDNTLMGGIILRTALAKSRNLASVRLILDIDPAYAAQYASNFGFTSLINPFPSLVLGGSDVTLLEMVKAYNVFANGGKLVEPKFIVRLYDRNGKILEDNTTGKLVTKNEFQIEKREKQKIEILHQLARRVGRPDSERNSKDNVLVERDTSVIDSSLAPSMDTDSPVVYRPFFTPEEFLEFIKKNPVTLFSSRPGKQVIGKDTAYIMTDLLRAVIAGGTGRRARPLTHISPIAGKTGTTNNYTDAWFIGFSPRIVTGVWVGRDDHTTLGKKEAGSRAALPIWIDFMKDALRKYPSGDYDIPDGIHFVNTPYGFIPYKKGTNYIESEFKYFNSSYSSSPSGSEMDFLIRQ